MLGENENGRTAPLLSATPCEPGRSVEALPHDPPDGSAAGGAPPRGLTTAEAYLHLFKGNVGPGLLALPLSVARAKPLAGLLIIGGVVLQGVYGQWLMVRLERTIGAAATAPSERRRRLRMDEAAQHVFGPMGRVFVASVILVNQLGVCAVFIALVGENLRAVVRCGSRTLWALAAAAACTLLSLLPDLTSLTPLSAFGSIVMLVAIASAVGFGLVELLTPTAAPHHHHGERHGHLQPSVLGGPVTPSPPSLLVARPPLPPPLPPPPPPLPLLHAAFELGPTSALIACATNAFYGYEGVAIVLPIASQLSPIAYQRYPRTLLLAVSLVGAYAHHTRARTLGRLTCLSTGCCARALPHAGSHTPATDHRARAPDVVQRLPTRRRRGGRGLPTQ